MLGVELLERIRHELAELKQRPRFGVSKHVRHQARVDIVAHPRADRNEISQQPLGVVPSWVHALAHEVPGVLARAEGRALVLARAEDRAIPVAR